MSLEAAVLTTTNGFQKSAAQTPSTDIFRLKLCMYPFSDSAAAYRKLDLGHMWGCLTYPRSPAETHRDMGRSWGTLRALNSAGVRARNTITRCSRWQQRRSQSLPKVPYLPNNAAGSRGPGVMGNTPPPHPPPPVHIRNTVYNAPYIL